MRGFLVKRLIGKHEPTLSGLRIEDHQEPAWGRVPVVVVVLNRFGLR